MFCTRREFEKLALAVIPGLSFSPAVSEGRTLTADATATKPNSKVSGVEIGLNVPYSFGDLKMSGDDILQRCLDLGLSAVELRAQPVEAFLGAPAILLDPREARKVGPGAVEELRKWRLSVPMAKAKAFRRQYEAAGVHIEILKFDGIYAMTDAVLDYAFVLARTLGARAISCEISADGTERLGKFADRHKMMVGYHGHAAATPATWEAAFAQSRHNGANLDLGHFVAGNNTSPLPFLEEHHDRITHVHVKDRKMNNGPNVPFGEGDTPIKEVLQLIRDKRWPIQATIEFEYPVPSGSDRMTEIGKCLAFCREALA